MPLTLLFLDKAELALDAVLVILSGLKEEPAEDKERSEPGVGAGFEPTESLLLLAAAVVVLPRGMGDPIVIPVLKLTLDDSVEPERTLGRRIELGSPKPRIERFFASMLESSELKRARVSCDWAKCVGSGAKEKNVSN